MFAVTKRLLLRPGWSNDAPELARAIADEQIVMQLASAPWPYGVAEAEAFLSAPKDPVMPTFLVTKRDSGEIVGCIGLGRRPSGAIELGYWIARAHWGQGFASEAGAAVIDIARTLGFPALEASHYVNNPASGRVLEKLGFTATGMTGQRMSCARGHEVDVKIYTLVLGAAAAEGRVAA